VKHALSSIFVHMISGMNSDINTSPTSIKDIVRRAISSLDSRGISVPTYVMTHTMRLLVNRWQHQEAVDFWGAISRREGHPPAPVNLNVLTTLLRAYIGLRDPTGIEWVVNTLRLNNISPDRRFQQILVKGLRASDKLTAPFFAHCLVQALNTINDLRVDVTREKEIAKMKILKLMEGALSAEKAEHPESSDSMEAGAEKFEIDLREFRLADSTAAWKYRSDKSAHKIDTAPPASLVGVAAG